MRGDASRNPPRGKTKEVSAFLDDGGAHVGGGPHVSEDDLAGCPPGELARRADRQTRLGRKVDGDEKPKRIGSHFGYFIRVPAVPRVCKEET